MLIPGSILNEAIYFTIVLDQCFLCIPIIVIESCLLFIEQPCLVCGNGGSVMCSECCKEEAFVNGIKKPFFCNACSNMWHGHYKRKQHKPWVKKCQDFATGTLQLLSVLCIETSHYVCFTRITGSGKDEWVFFDSMAKRPGNFS